jgi:hypothetical protein
MPTTAHFAFDGGHHARALAWRQGRRDRRVQRFARGWLGTHPNRIKRTIQGIEGLDLQASDINAGVGSCFWRARASPEHRSRKHRRN